MTSEIAGQNKAFTVEELYSYEGWTRFNGNQWASMNWVPDGGPWLGRHASSLAFGRPEQPVRACARGCGSRPRPAHQPLFTHAQLESALVKSGRAVELMRAPTSRRRPSNFNAERDAFLLTIADDLYVYDIGPRGRRG